jgi:hypothetical protein
MKKLLLIAVLILAVMAMAVPVSAQNVTADWIDGNLVYKDASGNQITKWDGANRAFEIPSGSVMKGFSTAICTITMAAVDYTLSAAEALCSILEVAGSPSGQAIIAPTVSVAGVSVPYTVRNAGADSAAVTIKKSGGTGVEVATGKTARVFWSGVGSDYVRETADATH